MRSTAKSLQLHTTRLDRFVRTYNFSGLVLGSIFFYVSQFPTLLPRSWFFQGLVSGIAIAIGYGLGVLLSFTVRWLLEREPGIKGKSAVWKVFYCLTIPLALLFVILGGIWQNELRTVLEVTPVERTYVIRVLLMSALVGIGCIGLGRSVRSLYHRFVTLLDRLLPRRISIAAGFTLVTVFVIWLVTGAFFAILGDVSSVFYNRKNNSTPEGTSQPTSITRSGSAESLIAWNTLGYQGKKFVAKGPSQAKMQEFNGLPAKQSIRIYAGVKSADTADARAKLVMDEIHRTDAFSRKVLVIATPTGTGWLNPQTVDALEYIHNGDTAIVAQQYSYLPSWISFLVDKEKAQDSAKELFNAVYAEWATLPANDRPKLIVYGLSLGSFGGQAAFSGAGSLVSSIDGALWQGTPGDTALWREITAGRDNGSPEWQPTVRDGNHIRFASSNEDITRNQDTWSKQHRVLYMQHGSDPIVWFNLKLPLQKPDWYSEKRAPDVVDNTVWVPFLSFFQLAADQVVGMNVPRDYGHNYETTVANAWAAVSTPDDWSEAKAQKLQAIINKY